MVSSNRINKKLSMHNKNIKNTYSEKIVAAVIEATFTKKKLVSFISVTCFYSIKRTWIAVIKMEIAQHFQD